MISALLLGAAAGVASVPGFAHADYVCMTGKAVLTSGTRQLAILAPVGEEPSYRSEGFLTVPCPPKVDVARYRDALCMLAAHGRPAERRLFAPTSAVRTDRLCASARAIRQ